MSATIVRVSTSTERSCPLTRTSTVAFMPSLLADGALPRRACDALSRLAGLGRRADHPAGVHPGHLPLVFRVVHVIVGGAGAHLECRVARGGDRVVVPAG